MSPAETFDHPAVDVEAVEWERTYAMWTHLAGLIGAVTAAFSVGASLLVVLLLWLIKRDQSPFVDDHGREAVNFQISILIYTLLVVPIGIITCGIGAILIVPIMILAIVGAAMAASAAHNGRYYRYPATIRLLKS